MDTLSTLIKELIDLRAPSNSDIVGNEAISFNVLRDHFTRVNSVTTRLLSTLNPDSDHKIVSLRAKDVVLNRKVIEAGYIAIGDVDVYKPSAFVGNVGEFVRMLGRVSPTIETMEGAIGNFEGVLAKFIHEPELLTKVGTGLKKADLPDADKTVELFADFFLGRAGIDTAPINLLYGNMKDITKSGDQLMNITERFNGIDVRTVRIRGDSLYKTLEYVEGELEHLGLSMTNKWRKAIGDELYRITQWLAIYALFVTKTIAISVSHRDTVAKLNNL